MSTRRILSAFAPVVLLPLGVHAHVFECRIVERIGSVDHVLPGDQIVVRPGTTHRYRIQFRVVPDDENDARGGFISWFEGTMNTTGGINTRTAAPPNPTPRGRLFPYLAVGSTGDGHPQVDPFTNLTGIDAALNFNTFLLTWTCSPEGVPNPRPDPQVYGRGTFISVFDFTSVATSNTYTVSLGGMLNTADEWTTGMCQLPPDCGDPADPADDKPSSCLRFPLTQTQPSFSYVFTVRVCAAEWNDDRRLDSQDFFAFLQDFFEGSADFDHDGTTNSADLFAFLQVFLGGC